ncbi:MAG: nuclear transport factor 2 family protein [Comamonas sp.]|jgi:3-phenylpropionate/cinnamic acid dioxygenase small subunit|uniref:nuclear transport factor 2 family protein n=1 Tax=Comamonas sp. TaxID=34028 RepID=UPI00282D0D6D|nr:nuclear transport factor 2 family protein [Comamonas sp.]MDR0215965.1 nuclear transport factor 2 family protein [Comamonas sp.]
MTLQEISDKVEINELLARYCHALDQKDWSAFQEVFLPDASLDFTAFGGPKGSPGELQKFFSPILSSLASTQHTVSTVKIDLKGDDATVRSAAIVPMTAMSPEGKESTFVSGLWYEDACQRTKEGWKIKSRRQVRSWAGNMA